MQKFYLILLFCFVSVLFAQDQASFQNALGWESGLSYRRYLTKKTWLGINLTGSYNNELTKASDFDSTKTFSNDSTSKSSTSYNDTSISYSGTVKIEFGREIFTYKRLAIDAYIAAGYTYSDMKTFNGSEPYFNDEPSQSVLGIIGLEPKVFIFDRISLGTQLGLQYTYTYSKDTYNSTLSNSSWVDVERRTTSYFTSYLRLFGSISLSTALVVFWYF
jgi:hypothetical protein